MLNEAHLPASFWWDAAAAFVHAHNRSPTSAVSGKTPYELWFNSKPDVSHLRVFGCTSYVLVKKDQHKQLQSHTQKCVFLGYPSNYKGWVFWNPMTRKEVISDSAQFDERVFPGTSKTPVDLRVKEVEDLPEQGGVEIEADVLPAPPPPPAPAQPADPPAPSTMPTLILHPVHHIVLLHLLIREVILQSLLSKGQGPMHLSIQTALGGLSDTTLHNGGRSLMKERGCPDLFQALQFHHSTSNFQSHQHLLILHLSQRL